MAHPRSSTRVPQPHGDCLESRGFVAVAEDESEGKDLGHVLAVWFFGILVWEEP